MPCRTRCVGRTKNRKTCACTPVLLSPAPRYDRGQTNHLCGPVGATILCVGLWWAGAGQLPWGTRHRTWPRWRAASYPNLPFEYAAECGRLGRRHSRLRRPVVARPACSFPAVKCSMFPTPPPNLTPGRVALQLYGALSCGRGRAQSRCAARRLAVARQIAL